MLTFTFNTTAFGWFEVVVILALIKVLLRVGVVLLGKLRGNPFDIRKLPEFLVDDILLQIGGLTLLLMTTFLVLPDDTPQVLLGLWELVQGSYYAAAAFLAGKFAAKIKDIFPIPPNDDADDVSAEDRAVADQAVSRP